MILERRNFETFVTCYLDASDEIESYRLTSDYCHMRSIGA